MDNYLTGIRKSKSSGFGGFKFLGRFNDKEVPDMSNSEVHIEYKEPSFFRKLFAWRRQEKISEAEEDLTEEQMAKLNSVEGEIEAIEEEETAIEEMEEELEEKRQGLLSRLWQNIKLFERRPVDNYGEEDFSVSELTKNPVLDEDVKEVLKIAHSWIGHLSPVKKNAFKNSDDFVKYKEILMKYGLVKEKGDSMSQPQVQLKPKIEEISIEEVGEEVEEKKVSNTLKKSVKKK